MNRALIMVAVIGTLVLMASATVKIPGLRKSPCGGKKNTIPINTEAPKFVSQVKNGKRYIAGQGNDTFHIAHVYGNYTEMGTAYGELFKDLLPQQIKNFNEYIVNEIEGALPWFPKAIAELIVDYGAYYLLELTYNDTVKYTPQRYIDELDAISAAAGLDKWILRSISQFPEAIKAACTIVGANKDATMKGVTKGGIAHLRALDLGAKPTIKDIPMVTVYHPSDGTPAFANFGWLAFTGSLTSMSEEVIGLGEKVWGGSSIWNGSVFGEAWTFVNRDVMRVRTMEEVIQILDQSKRTCGIHLGIGDSKTNTFLGFQVNAKQVNIFNDSTITPYPQHPFIKDVMYWDKYEQPTHSYCLETLLQEGYGDLSAEYLATTVAAVEQSGDIHAATFDYPNKVAYFANARKTWDPNGSIDAYARQWTKLDMNALFTEQKPSL